MAPGFAESNNLLWSSNLMPGWRAVWRTFCARAAELSPDALVNHAGWVAGRFRVRWDRPVGPETQALECELARMVAATCQLCGRPAEAADVKRSMPGACARHRPVVFPKAATPDGEPDYVEGRLQRAWVDLENGYGERAEAELAHAEDPRLRALRAIAGHLRGLGQGRALAWLDEPRAELGGEWPRARLAIAEPGTLLDVARLLRLARRVAKAGGLAAEDVRMREEHGPTRGGVEQDRRDDKRSGLDAEGGFADLTMSDGPGDDGTGGTFTMWSRRWSPSEGTISIEGLQDGDPGRRSGPTSSGVIRGCGSRPCSRRSAR